MAQNQFDFQAYNTLVNSAGSGLKLHLAIQMLESVDYVMYKFKNPLQTDLRACISELTEIRTKAKEQATQRAKS